MNQITEQPKLWDRVLDALDTPWERPCPTTRQFRNDFWIWLIYLVIAQLMIICFVSVGLYQNVETSDLWKEFLGVGLITVPMVFRRKFPISMLVFSTVLFYALGLWIVVSTSTFAFQVAYFVVLYSSVAWAQDRRNLWIIYALTILTTIVWLVVGWTIEGSAYSLFGDSSDSSGPFSVPIASFIYGVLINGVFYGGALILGNMAWKNAYHQEILRQQREQIILQSDRLAQDAVIEDRLRIARELHDSIGHHIAAIGVQATAAQRFAEKKPELLKEPLTNIEELTRRSVAEMRAVLGVLRSEDSADRDPQLTDISSLTVLLEDAGIHISVTREESKPGVVESLSQGISLSLFRIVQEAVNNIIKHASAQNAEIAVRSTESWIEVEITDDGKATGVPSSRLWGREITTGGFGLRGIRERAQALGGETEIGERQGKQGWRVRVRVPVK